MIAEAAYHVHEHADGRGESGASVARDRVELEELVPVLRAHCPLRFEENVDVCDMRDRRWT